MKIIHPKPCFCKCISLLFCSYSLYFLFYLGTHLENYCLANFRRCGQCNDGPLIPAPPDYLHELVSQITTLTDKVVITLSCFLWHNISLNTDDSHWKVIWTCGTYLRKAPWKMWWFGPIRLCLVFRYSEEGFFEEAGQSIYNGEYMLCSSFYCSSTWTATWLCVWVCVYMHKHVHPPEEQLSRNCLQNTY